MNRKKLFITFEGIDGCGKTSVMNIVKDNLEKKYEVFSTREPGGTPISEKIRNIILESQSSSMNTKTEALLFAAARSQLIHEKIIPELSKNKIVLCDRFIDSSLVYQGIGRSLGINYILNINNFIMDDCWPNVTYFIDIAPKDTRKFIASREAENNRFDNDDEEESFHNKIYRGFLYLLDMFPDRIKRIDGYRNLEDIAAEITKDIERLENSY